MPVPPTASPSPSGCTRPIFAAEGLFDDAGVQSGDEGPDPTIDPESLKHYLEKLDPQDFGRFSP